MQLAKNSICRRAGKPAELHSVIRIYRRIVYFEVQIGYFKLPLFKSFEGVLHEFSSLAGVREDITDLVLNVKQVALRMEGDQPRRLALSATGPGEVTAGQIATTGDIEVMNGDLVLCHLDEGATLNMELTAEAGKGPPAASQPELRGRQSPGLPLDPLRFPAAANRPADAPIGIIPVDALYSPVRQDGQARLSPGQGGRRGATST
jgi:DNA-directed RNA polymerase alpha subunit